MMKVKARILRLALCALLLGAVATVPALAGPSVIGSAAGSTNASLGGHALLPNTTIFSGDSLQVADGVAVIAVGNNNRVIFGRDTAASFLRDSNEVTVLLSQGNLSMLHPNDGTPLNVKAGEVSITPAAGLKTIGEIAMLNGSLVITAKEGALQVEDHGATKNVAKGETIVIAPKSAKGGAGGGTSAVPGAEAISPLGSASALAVEGAASAANAAASDAKTIRPNLGRPLSGADPIVGAAAAAAAAANSGAVCAPPTVPTGFPASTYRPLAATAGPICPLGASPY
jgi:hypothetical protein